MFISYNGSNTAKDFKVRQNTKVRNGKSDQWEEKSDQTLQVMISLGLVEAGGQESHGQTSSVYYLTR